MTSTRIAEDVFFDRDVEIRMRDGVRLMANVFRPVVDRPCPVVMSVTLIRRIRRDLHIVRIGELIVAPNVWLLR